MPGNDPKPLAASTAGGDDTVDLFVSYAHADDKVPAGARNGWVTTLVGQLKLVLQRKLGGTGAQVWMDHALAANQPLTATLRDRVSRSRTMLIVLSPGYVKSTWCQRELCDFVTAAQARGEAENIFAVELEPIDRDSQASLLPAPIRELVPIAFWERDGDDEPRLAGYPTPKADEYSKYWKLVNRLAGQLARRLARALPAAPAPAAGAVVAPLSQQPAPIFAGPDVTAEPVDIPQAHGLSLYLHAAPEDQPLAGAIADQLDAVGVMVLCPSPRPQQSFQECLLEHENALRQCQGMLLLNTGERIANLMSAWQLARRIFGARRAGPWSAALHLPPPGHPDLPIRNVLQVDCRNGFDIRALGPFFAALQADGNAHPSGFRHA